jgi:predicted  nucleic acid-binding Zn-ribbon protein
MKTEQELLTLKGKIESAKTAVAQLKGQELAGMKQLEEQDCKTIKQAEGKLSNFDLDIAAIDEKIKLAVQNLEKQLI